MTKPEITTTHMFTKHIQVRYTYIYICMRACVWESVTHKTLAITTVATIMNMTMAESYAYIHICMCMCYERLGLQTCACHLQQTNNQLTVHSCVGKVIVVALNLFVYATFTRAVVVYCSFPISDFLFWWTQLFISDYGFCFDFQFYLCIM